MGSILEERKIGPLTILFGEGNGKYPHGNTLHVRGTERSVIIDPCLGMLPRKENLPEADMILLSHTHEDHIAGIHLFPEIPCHIHALDALGLESMEGLLDVYGFEGELRAEFEKTLYDEFFYESREDIHKFVDGDIIDLGGVSIKVLHTPGHTRGHSCFIIDWEGSKDSFVYLGDIELTGFGPYYGDAWSSLADFEESIERLRHLDAKWWLTFHHKGLIESRGQFLEMLEAYSAMIDFRERKLLDFLVEEKSMAEIVSHRFVYRPGSEGRMVDQIERRSMSMHLDRLLESGRVKQTNTGFERV